MKKNVAVAAAAGVEAELLKATGKAEMKDGESVQKYRARLCRAANDLDPADWKKLSEPAQEWVNSAVELMNEKEEIGDFPGAKKVKAKAAKAAAEDDEAADDDSADEAEADAAADAEDDDEAEPAEEGDATDDEEDAAAEPDDEEDGDEAPAKPAAKKKGKVVKNFAAKAGKVAKAAPAAKPEAKAGKAGRPKGAKGESRRMFVWRYVCKHPRVSAERLVEAVVKAGYGTHPTEITSERRNIIKIMGILRDQGALVEDEKAAKAK